MNGLGEGRLRGARLVSALLLSVLAVASCTSSAAQPLPAETPRVATQETASPATSAALPESPSPEPTATASPAPTPEPLPTVLAAVAAPAAASSTYRIEIPRLGINLPVVEGDIQRDVERSQTPEHYAFHLPGTSMFGPGNTYIYSHARVGMFLSLWNVKLGDLVIIRTPNGPREYLVEEIHPRVPPTEISWAGPTQDTRLTLQTSTGPYGTDPRFVVVARPR